MISNLITSETKTMFNSLVTAIWLYDVERYRIIWANQSALAFWESDGLEELTSRDFRQGSSDAVQQALIDYQHIFKSGQSITRVWRYSPGGILKEAYIQLSGYELSDGRMAILTEALPLDLVKNNTASASVSTLSTYDINGNFVSGNPPFLETQNSDFLHLKSLFVSLEDYKRVTNIIQNDGRFEDDIQILIRNVPFWHRLVVSVCGQQSNKTILVQQYNIEQRKQKELKLERDVITDPLTGLLNRRGLQQAVKNAEQLVVYYLDLDGFKLVNDSFGHQVGDQLLKHLALKLTSGELASGCACRFGGDEFIWSIEKDKMAMGIEQMANLLLNQMSEPYEYQSGRSVSVSASIGVALYPEHDDNFENLILKADAAMYLAKKQGKHRWVSYITSFENQVFRQSEVTKHLNQALQNREFELHYQPIFDTANNQVHSLEALLRWHNDKLGNVPPEEFIKVAEEIGTLFEIERWVVQQAISDIPLFQSIFGNQIAIAINVSSQCFCDPELPSLLIQTLEQHQLPRSAVNLELTECTLVTDVDQDSKSVLAFQHSGIPISIDDFGTGFSSLSYLHEIPAEFVKIDRSFTQSLEKDKRMMKSIENMLRTLGFTPIVEGVENKAQSKILNTLGMHIQQGFGLCRPQPLSFYQDEENIKHLPILMYTPNS